MEEPRIRLGGENAWLELARIGEGSWRVTADWCSCLTADFSADLTDEEAAEFAARMLSQLPTGRAFSARVTPGRNNPLRLGAQPAGDGWALFAYLTPGGDDEVCHMQLEINPIGATDLRDMFDEFHASLLP